MRGSFHKTLLKFLPNTVLAVDSDGIVRYINHSNPYIKQATAIGKSWHQSFPRHCHAAIDKAMKKAHQNGKRVRVECSLSEKQSWKVTIIPVDSTKENISTMLELSDKSMSKKRADLRTQLIANMSHEIRTPLSGIIGLTQLILDTKLKATQIEYLNLVQKSADKLLILINDLLDFSKIEARKLHIDRIDFSLRDCVYGILHILTASAAEKGIELICDIRWDVPDRLIGDPKRLSQIIMNLVENAIKFMEEGEVILEVKKESQTKKDATLHFSVMDTGIGISKEKQKIIFEPFMQANWTTTRKVGGTGLGLSISAQLVDIMGGKIWIVSPLKERTTEKGGPGSILHFILPYKLLKNENEVLDSKDVDKLFGIPILVAEDNITTRSILRKILTRFGMKPTFVNDCGVALAKMNRISTEGSPYPLVLLDADIPKKTGINIAEQIQQNPKLTPTVIMMLSSLNDDICQCEEIGIDSYLLKPVKESELREKLVQRVLEQESKPKSFSGTQVSIDKKSESALSIPKEATKILVVDDDSTNLLVVETVLKKKGWQVFSASSGEQALKILDSETFDIILMDIHMSDMDGFDTTAKIRKKEAERNTPHTPIIAVTARFLKKDKERCLHAGMDDYLTKPIRTDALYEVIEKHKRKMRAKKILLIEDNHAHQKILLDLLEKHSYHVMIAEDGLEGLNMARREKPDLIILDLLLPQMNGHEVTRMLKLDSGLLHIPIVMFTIRDHSEDEQLAKKSGVDAFLPKTINHVVLLDEIDQLIGRK